MNLEFISHEDFIRWGISKNYYVDIVHRNIESGGVKGNVMSKENRQAKLRSTVHGAQ
jgi:hypothetical protein